MSEQLVNVDNVTDGKTTSEYKMMVIVQIVGGVLEAAALVLHKLQDAGLDFPWISVALLVIGAILQVASYVGYNKGRAALKVSLVQSQPLVTREHALSVLNGQTPPVKSPEGPLP